MNATLALAAVLLAADETPVEFDVVPVDGDAVKVTQLTGTGQRFAGVTLLGKGERKEWTLADLVAIRFTAAGIALARPIGTQVVLATGESISCSLVLTVGSDNTAVRGNLFGDLTLPTSVCAGFIIDPEASDQNVASAIKWMKKKRTGDAVLFKNFDEAVGSLVEMTDSTAKLTVDKRDRTIPRNQLLAVALDASLTDNKPPRGTHALVRLSDGTQVRVEGYASVGASPKVVDLKTVYGATIRVDVAQIVDLSVREGRASYLSDRTAKATRITPFLDDKLSPRMDRNALGDPLRLAGAAYSKGIGCVSGTILEYDVDGAKRFDALVGLDEAAGKEGNVRFEALVDGKSAFDSGAMSAADKPKPVRVELKGAKKLTLRVGYAARGDTQDFADWVDARLVK